MLPHALPLFSETAMVRKTNGANAKLPPATLVVAGPLAIVMLMVATVLYVDWRYNYPKASLHEHHAVKTPPPADKNTPAAEPNTPSETATASTADNRLPSNLLNTLGTPVNHPSTRHKAARTIR